MAGIAFMSRFQNNIYFLFGRENKYAKTKFQYSDFGGHSEKGETLKETAYREAYEETSGILGNIGYYKYLIDNKLIKTYTIPKKYGGYRTYLVEIDYDKKLPIYFNNSFRFVNSNTTELVKAYNGLYEKDKMKWFSINELKKEQKIFRIHYRNIIKQIIKDYERNFFNKKK